MKNDSIHEELIIAGFGGQGVILAGKLLAQTAMKAGKYVTYMPAYGAEVRGGTSNCTVIIADNPIASPLADRPGCVIAMNKASLDKFAPRLKKNGLLIFNRSLINPDSLPEMPDEAAVLPVPADELAVRIGNPKAANMIALGAYLRQSRLFSPDQTADALPEVLAPRYHHTLPVNTQALRQGANFAKEYQSQLADQT